MKRHDVKNNNNNKVLTDGFIMINKDHNASVREANGICFLWGACISTNISIGNMLMKNYNTKALAAGS